MTNPPEVNRLILDAATGARRLTPEELRSIIEHVAQAGFDPTEREQAGGRLAGIEWQGQTIRGRDWLSPSEAHYLRHVVVQREWPVGTTLQGYLDSIAQVITDRRSGVVTSQYQGAWQLAILRRSHELRGSEGAAWILVDYRVALGRWVTAFQPREGLAVLRRPERGGVRWLRRPR